MKTDAHVLICYNAPVALYEHYSGKDNRACAGADDMSESGFQEELDFFCAAINEGFTKVTTYPVTLDISSTIAFIREMKPDVIFNLVESVEGISSYEAYMAGLYELLQVRYTGNTPPVLLNCLNKNLTKSILTGFGIKTPSYQVFHSPKDLSEKSFLLRFPVITKLLREDASIGISENSVVHSLPDLQKQVQYLFGLYRQEVLVEEYIEGREFNIALLNGEPLPVSEISFAGLPDGLPKIVTYEGKWIPESDYYRHTVPQCPADIDPVLASQLQELAVKAYQALNCRDYARVDIRVSEQGIPYVIEVNPNPDITDNSGFSRAMRAYGSTIQEAYRKIVSFALQRGSFDSFARTG